MTERQRPRETAKSFLDSLTYEFVEQRQTLEEISRFLSDDCIDLRGGHSCRRQQREIDLHARRRRNRAVQLVPGDDLLPRLEIHLDSERRLRPHRRVKGELARRSDFR